MAVLTSEPFTIISGPHDPCTSTPPRAARSVRRTTSIDTSRPDGLLGRLVLAGRARDLVTDADGDAVVAAEAAMELRADVLRSLTGIDTTPDIAGLQSLLGATVGPGFRSRLDAVAPTLALVANPLYLLLDDAPGAALVSGYALQHAGALGDSHMTDEFLAAQGDLCAGWANDASMMQAIRVTGRNPVVRGPVAPQLERADDPWSWPALPTLVGHSTRRRRRIDLIAPMPGGDGLHRVDVHFRDSHMSAAGVETVVHEYAVRATVDADTRTIVAIDATAHVLPWVECPSAVASALRLAEMPIAGLRKHVRSTFRGTTTCTHLNDVLRGLADVDQLLDLVPAT